MPDKLGRLMSEFSAQIRRYRNQEYARQGVIEGMSERDLAILDMVFKKGQATFAEISHELHNANVPKSSASSISQAISALYADRGFVDKRPNPKDQRQPIITLTEKGRVVVEKLHQARIRFLTVAREAMQLSNSESEIMERAFSRGIEYMKKNFSQEE